MIDEKWEEKFDETYGNDPKSWTLGIVAAALTHKQTKPIGADASYITTKLLKLIEEQKHISYIEGVNYGSNTDNFKAMNEKIANEGLKIGYNNALTDLHARIKSKMPKEYTFKNGCTCLACNNAVAWDDCLSQSLTAIDEAYEELKK